MSLHPLTVWEVLLRQIAAEGALTDATMQDLNGLFQKLLPPALEILDRGWVHKVVCPSNRYLYIVKGRSEAQYVCIGDYCPCQYFMNTVATDEAFMCKHLLAVQLREVLQPPLVPKQVSDADYAHYLTARTTAARSPPRKQRA